MPEATLSGERVTGPPPPTKTAIPSPTRSPVPLTLQPAGWEPTVSAALDRLIAEAPERSVAVFDFDNTIIHGDIGDALFETVAHHTGMLHRPLLQATAPDLVVKGNMPTPEALMDRYEFLCKATRHQEEEAVAAPGYTWIVQLMAGTSPAEIVRRTEETWSSPPAGRRYAIPFVYDEMIDLIGCLATAGIPCFIVSATNVWAVRWTVAHVVNSRLQEAFGPGAVIPPERVFGLNTLLRDRHTGRHWTDTALVRSDPAYARLDPEALERFELVPFFAPPMTTYGGKVGTVLQFIGNARPLLAAGDSLNDIPLLRYATNRLWIARLDRPDIQTRAVRLAGRELDASWLVQPAQPAKPQGFVPYDDVRAGAGAHALAALAPWRAVTG